MDIFKKLHKEHEEVAGLISTLERRAATRRRSRRCGPSYGDRPTLTTNQGIPVSDNQNSLRANAVGPTLLENFGLREKIMHFEGEVLSSRPGNDDGRVRTALLLAAGVGARLAPLTSSLPKCLVPVGLFLQSIGQRIPTHDLPAIFVH